MSLSSAALRPWFASCKRVADAPPLVAVRESLPWSFAGLVAGLIAFIALVPVQGPFFASLLKRVSLAELPAFGIMALALAAILSYRLALHLRLWKPAVVAASLVTFVLALPRPMSVLHPLDYMHRVGESGLFLAIVVALSVVAACSFLRRVVPSPIVADTLAGSTIILFALLLFDANVSVGNAVLDALRPLGALGDSYAALLVIVLVETLLWTIGIHGPAALAAVVFPLYMTLQQQNTAAFGHHEALPHIVVVSLFLFIFPGGAGSTLPLAALLTLSKVERLRTIGRLTIVPAIFNVNEPLMFGLPVVLNPYLAVPFVLAPLVLATITYGAVAQGLVARPAQWIPAAVPTLIAGYFATFDVRSIALVAINIAIATLIYLPFVRAYERHA
jgi:PTS system cellobiose-specific IIC component